MDNSTTKEVTPRYTLVRNVGKGSFGDVQLWIDQVSKKPVVSKKLSLEKSHKFLNSEILAGKALKHKNIVKFLHTVSNEEEGTAYLFFKYVDGKTLFDLLEARSFEPLKEDYTKGLFKQAIEAISCCHNKGFAHLDLKLENVMVSPEGKLTIIDFGLCRQTDSTTLLNCWVGSQDYAAPEIIRRIPYNGFLADVYSLGVILYIMLTGELPFSRSARYSAMEKGTYPMLSFPLSCTASSHARSLCMRMLEPEPSRRISLQEINQHPWLAEVRRTKSLGSNPFLNLIKNIKNLSK